jgi:hypothetical protein
MGDTQAWPARRLVDAVFFAVGWPANLQGLELAAQRPGGWAVGDEA